MAAARRIDRSAAGLVGRDDNRDEFGPEQRARQKQRLKLRIRTRRGKHDVGQIRRKTKMRLQFVPHRLDAGVEGSFDPDLDRRSHQGVARGFRPIKGAR